MAGIGEKPITRRECVASGEVRMRSETLAMISEKNDLFSTGSGSSNDFDAALQLALIRISASLIVPLLEEYAKC